MSAASATTARQLQRHLDNERRRRDEAIDRQLDERHQVVDSDAYRTSPVDSPLATYGMAALILVLSYVTFRAIDFAAQVVAVVR